MKIVIIGNGISGITCARWCRKLGSAELTVISSETKYFYSRTALMYKYMGHMRNEDLKPYEDWFWTKNRINLVQDQVAEIDFSNKVLQLKEGTSISYDKLVLALGSKPNKFGWPGQDLKGVGGLYHWQDLEKMESYLIGIEMAEMFRSRNIAVTMLVRESSYWNNVLPAEESKMISDHIKAHHIDLRLDANLAEIHDDGTGTAGAVTIKETGETISCGYVGLTAGVSPNIAFLKDSPLECGRGIKVNKQLQTNFPDVYAIGDCAELTQPVPGRRAIEAVWYTGRMMGETVAYNLNGKYVSYDPGIWFNSAKFLDIEYQVYGAVPSTLPDHMASLYWQHPSEDKAIRINYDKTNDQVLGFNLMGIRYRHEVCEQWLKTKTTIQDVLQDLPLANFDPEFCKLYEAELVKKYNSQSGTKIQLRKKRKLDQVLSFLKRNKT